MTSSRYQVVEVARVDSKLQVTWGDGHSSQYPGIWLINACDCDACGSTISAVRLRKLTDVAPRPELASAQIDVGGDIVVDWDGAHRSRFTARWLRNHCPSAAERKRRQGDISIWDESIAAQLPCMDYATVADDVEAHLRFLEKIHESGFAILQNVPPEREQTELVASLVGLLKMSNYGIYELEAKPVPEIVGDMAIPLNLHTDEPYRIDVPAITLFHVIAQSADGGESTLADGLYLAQEFLRQDPAAFELLCTIPARFHRVLKEGRWFDNSAPVISRDCDGRVSGIRLLDRGMAPIDTALENIEPFYDSLRKLLTLAYAGCGMITFKLQAGEMLVFNNQRLMHGRTAFDPNSGRRHVRSCHVDLDEFHSSLRMAYKGAGSDKCWNRFAAATR